MGKISFIVGSLMGVIILIGLFVSVTKRGKPRWIASLVFLERERGINPVPLGLVR